MSVIYLQEPASGKLKITTAGVDRTEVLPFLFALTLRTYEAPIVSKLLRTIDGVAVKSIGCDTLIGWSVS